MGCIFKSWCERDDGYVTMLCWRHLSVMFEASYVMALMLLLEDCGIRALTFGLCLDHLWTMPYR